jgi:hypothetical protein
MLIPQAIVEVAGGASLPIAAEDVSVADVGTNYTATDVEGVLAEIAPQLGGAVDADDESLILHMRSFA